MTFWSGHPQWRCPAGRFGGAVGLPRRIGYPRDHVNNEAVVPLSTSSTKRPAVGSDDPEPSFPGLEHPAPNAHGDAVALGVCAQPRGGRRPWSSPEISGRSIVYAERGSSGRARGGSSGSATGAIGGSLFHSWISRVGNTWCDSWIGGEERSGSSGVSLRRLSPRGDCLKDWTLTGATRAAINVNSLIGV